MEAETTISQSITSDACARYDACCKRILSEKSILAWIMRACLREYRGCSVEEIANRYIEGHPQVGEIPVSPGQTNAGSRIGGLGSEDAVPNEGNAVFDIRFQAVAPDGGMFISLLINLEAQNDYYPGYPLPKRAIYYCGRMISAQQGVQFANSHYEKLQKVYSIWICTNPPKCRANTITLYSIGEHNLVGSVRENVRNYDLMSVIMICLGDPEEAGQSEALRLLDALFSPDLRREDKRRILSDEFQIPMSEALESEVSLMCNLSQGVLERGIKLGEERGIKLGEERGIKLGEERTALRSLRALIGATGMSPEQAMRTLDIPKGEWDKYKTLLRAQL